MNRLTLILLIGYVLAVSAEFGKPWGQLSGENAGIYQAYDGPTRADEEVATLLVPKGGWLIVREDGRASRKAAKITAPYKEVKLLPGATDISWGKYSSCVREVVELEAGHSYLLGVKRGLPEITHGDALLWMEDTLTGEIVVCCKPNLRPGQTQPPLSFRARVPFLWARCFSLRSESPKPPAVVKRREMIIELGDKMLTSARFASRATYSKKLARIAFHNESIPARGCSGEPEGKQTDKLCRWVRRDLRRFRSHVESEARKDKLSRRSAADLLASAEALLAEFERPPARGAAE